MYGESGGERRESSKMANESDVSRLINERKEKVIWLWRSNRILYRHAGEVLIDR